MTQVLVIDDEVQIRRLLRIYLENQGFKMNEAPNGGDGLRAIAGVKPDIVLLDLGLPDMDGLEVLKSLRSWSSVPVIVLSVRNSEEDVVELLNAGADDYMIKPFNTGELAARIHVALRHHLPLTKDESFIVGRLNVDLENRVVVSDGEEIKLTPTEYAILRLLVQHAGKILTHSHILREIWGPNSGNESNNLRVYVTQLRKKIEKEPSRPEVLVTEPGVGYRLKI
jgi:two-component system, OmpR family, KDP operon response regulator KdpE